jgi:hypothetical protein
VHACQWRERGSGTENSALLVKLANDAVDRVLGWLVVAVQERVRVSVQRVARELLLLLRERHLLSARVSARPGRFRRHIPGPQAQSSCA